MKSAAGVFYVGLYASFPITKDDRKASILSSVLDLEGEWPFRRALVGKLDGKSRWERFKQERKPTLLGAIKAGKVDTVTLVDVAAKEDFARSFEAHVNAYWQSALLEPNSQSRSPLVERFGSAGSLIVQYPLSRFKVREASTFQQNLLNLLKRLFVEQDLYWAFVHLGFQPVPLTAYGMDIVFQDTRNTFPLTSFEPNLTLLVGLYKEFVKGAFWANFLNRVHVGRLGGVSRVLRERPCETIEELDDGKVFLLVDESPLVEGEVYVVEHRLPSTPPVVRTHASSHVVEVSPATVAQYQRLRRFLSPLLIETPEDLGRIQQDILGSWRPDA